MGIPVRRVLTGRNYHAAAVFAMISIGLLTASSVYSQSASPGQADWEKAAGGKMEFEVASIHLGEPDHFKPPLFAISPDDSYAPTGGRFFADFPLPVYIGFAYKILMTEERQSALLAHMPKWVGTESFVIEARAPGNPTKDQMRLMVRSLLEERFKLAMHFETQTVPVLQMVLAKPGTLGPNLRPHDQGPACDESPPPITPELLASRKDVFPVICGGYMLKGAGNGEMKLGSRDTTMTLLADSLPSVGNLGRPIVDETGLTGRYDFTLEWTPDPHTAPIPVAAPDENEEKTSFLEAVHEQLGLKLKPSKGPILLPVIDHVEQPSPN